MRTPTQKLVTTGLMIALGLLLPSFFHMFGAGGVMLPMHIPVLLCGLVCGAPYGAACGLLLPLLSSVFTGMPPLFPTAPAMALELCCYGALTGLFFRRLNWNLYLSLVAAMLAGRVVSGLANTVLMGMAGRPYGFEAFLSAAFVVSLPGILLQLVLVPAIVAVLVKAHLITRSDAPKPALGAGECK